MRYSDYVRREAGASHLLRTGRFCKHVLLGALALGAVFSCTQPAGPGTTGLTGSLSITLTWPAALVANPVIQAQLVPVTGSPTALTFSTPSNGSASYSRSGIMNGKYTLTLQLYDGSTVIMGEVDIVEIVPAQTTARMITPPPISKGNIEVNVTPIPVDPLTVTMSGQPSSPVSSGSPVTLSASVPVGTGNVVNVWYVNGVSEALGSSFVLNDSTSPLVVGTYRVDVTAFTADGLQAGDATTTITVAATSP